MPDSPSPKSDSPASQPKRWYTRPESWVFALQKLVFKYRLLKFLNVPLSAIQQWLHIYWLLDWQRSQVNERRKLTLPEGERVRIPRIWLTEVFTPSGSTDLRTHIRRSGWTKTSQTGLNQGLDEWFTAIRGSSETRGWRTIATLRPKESTQERAIDFSSVVDRLPLDFDRVRISAISVSPTVTVIVAGFDVAESAQLRLMELLTDSSGPRVRRTDGRRVVLTEDDWKELAAAEERERLVGVASRWLAKRLPGSFARISPNRHPASLLVLTDVTEPFNKESLPLMRALGLDSPHLAWQGREFPGLVLQEARDKVMLPSSQDRFILAGRFDAIVPDEALRGIAGGRSIQSILYTLDMFEMRNMHAALAISTLLQRYESTNARIRDLARKTHRRRSIASNRRLREILLTHSLDLISLTADIGDDENNVIAATLRRRQPEFDAFGTNADARRKYGIETNFWDEVYLAQSAKARRLRDAEGSLREILSSVTSLNSAIASSRLQRAALTVAVTSALIAILALLLSAKVIDINAVAQWWSDLSS